MAKLYAIGLQYNGALGLPIGSDGVTTSLTQIGTDDDWLAVAHSNYCMYALKDDGSLYTAGWNQTGLLGVGDSNTSTKVYGPAEITSVAGVTAIKACPSSRYFAYLQTATGNLFAWGDNAQRPNLGVGGSPFEVDEPTIVATGVGALNGLALNTTEYVYLLIGTTLYRLTSTSGLGTSTATSVLGITSVANSTGVGVAHLIGTTLYDTNSGSTIATNVAAVSKQPSADNGKTGFVKTDGTLWTLSAAANPLTASQLGSATDWVSLTTGYGSYAVVAQKVNGSLHGVTSGGSATELVAASFATVSDYASSTEGLVVLLELAGPPPPPPDFWTSFVKSHEVP
jgi:hypothetical protein